MNFFRITKIVVIIIIAIPIYGIYIDQIIFGPDFCTLNMKRYDADYFKTQVAEMDLENSMIVRRDISNGWEKREFLSKERFSGFGTTAAYAYQWYYDTKDGGMGAPCIYMTACGKIVLNGDSGECSFMADKLRSNRY